jgi:hypothetical protein
MPSSDPPSSTCPLFRHHQHYINKVYNHMVFINILVNTPPPPPYCPQGWTHTDDGIDRVQRQKLHPHVIRIDGQIDGITLFEYEFNGITLVTYNPCFDGQIYTSKSVCVGMEGVVEMVHRGLI